MKLLLLCVLLGITRLTFADDTTRCVDGDSDALFPADAFPADPANKQVMPEVDYSADGKAKGIKWTAADGIRRVETVIGRYDQREIVDITFCPLRETDKDSNEPFALKLLAYRKEPPVTSPLQPFFILTGENVRWFQQTFEGAPNKPFCLAIRRTIPGNGVMWSAYTFRFAKRGAWVEEIREGGRKMSTTITTFAEDGQVTKVQKIDEN